MDPPMPETDRDVNVSDGSFLLHLDRGSVDENGIVLTSSGEQAASYMGCTMAQPEYDALNATVDERHEFMNASVAVVRSSYSQSFFHVVAETLPRVAMVLPVLKAKPLSKLLVDCDQHGLVVHLLKLVKVPLAQIRCRTPKAALTSLREVFFPAATPCGSTQGALAMRFRAGLPPGIQPVMGESIKSIRRVILYKRRGMPTRQLTNHDALSKALQARSSVPVVEHDGYGTLEQQLAQFHTARCQVGPHGAALVMMMFAPSDFGTAEVSPGAYFAVSKKSSATELAPGTSFEETDEQAGTANRCFRNVAAQLGMQHVMVLINNATSRSNMTPSVDEVVDAASDACGERSVLRRDSRPDPEVRLHPLRTLLATAAAMDAPSLPLPLTEPVT